MGEPRRVVILGSTGSIGRQTIEAMVSLGDGWRVVGLAAGSDGAALAAQARGLSCGDVAIADKDAEGDFGGACVRRGPDAAETLVREVEADLVVAAIVGSAGLGSTLAALELGRDVALANKETLVSAGSIAVRLARESGARMLPIDSEHSGAWQCLPGWPACPMDTDESVAKVTLTASGGALRGASDREYFEADAERALAHPTWDMGAKVTVDCATLMNKGLELIEARWLFGLGNDRLGVLVHLQSIVHALVEMRDGSVLAQLGTTDMKTAIQAALAWPDRAVAPAAARLDLAAVGRLEFEAPNADRHAALGLARRVIDEGGTFGAALTAANEEAVGAFLAGRVPLGRVPELAGEAMEALGRPEAALGRALSLEDVIETERAARERVRSAVGSAASGAGRE
jgi:1-deoxy-D-xylulose-5-phosphate reductoisomerase